MARGRAPVRPREPHPPAAATLQPGAEPGRERLGVPAPEQARPAGLARLRRDRRDLLRGLELARGGARPARLHHPPRVGQSGQQLGPLVLYQRPELLTRHRARSPVAPDAVDRRRGRSAEGAMTVAITRRELGTVEPRREARRCRDTAASRRMLALALVLEGASREEAARGAGMDRQTLRDWGHRHNAEGLAGPRDRPRSGRGPRLTAEQEAELVTAVERGPDPDRDGVVRWRRVDLRALIEARFAVRLHERTVGKVLRRLGLARLSVRPRHPQAGEAAQEAFKKASPSWWRERCPSRPGESGSRSGFKMKPAPASGARCPGWGRAAAPGPGRPATAGTPGPTCSARSARSGPS